MHKEPCEFFSTHRVIDSGSDYSLRFLSNMDVGMQQLLNAQQREMHEWPELFRQADPRFQYVGAYQPPGAMRWIIEAKWQG